MSIALILIVIGAVVLVLVWMLWGVRVAAQRSARGEDDAHLLPEYAPDDDGEVESAADLYCADCGAELYCPNCDGDAVE